MSDNVGKVTRAILCGWLDSPYWCYNSYPVWEKGSNGQMYCMRDNKMRMRCDACGLDEWVSIHSS